MKPEQKEHFKRAIKKIAELKVLMDKAKPMYDICTNPNRVEIIEIVAAHEPISIKDITKKVGLAYKNVHAHIQMMAKYNLLNIEKNEKVSGRPVMVSLNEKFLTDNPFFR